MSEAEMFEEEEEERIGRRKGGGNAARFIDIEAEVSDEDEVHVSADEDEDEEDAGAIGDFIVSEEEEEEDMYDIDEEEELGVDDYDADDLELVADGLGIKVSQGGKKKGKRLVKGKRKNRPFLDDDDEEEVEDDYGGIVDEDEDSAEELARSFKYKKQQRKQKTFDYGRDFTGGDLGINIPPLAIEIFGDMTDFLGQEKVVYDEAITEERRIDPTIAESMLITKEDDIIRQTDLPERLQARVYFREKLTESSISEEVDWIISQAFTDKMRELQNTARHQFQTAVGDVVRFIREENLEVPFINCYKKEYYQPHLTISDVWVIDEYDEKWDHYLERRSRLERTLYRFPGESRSLINLASNEADIDDINNYLQYKLLNLLKQKTLQNEHVAESIIQRKIPSKRGFLQWEYASNLEGFVAEVLGNMKIFSENLASKFVGQRFPAPRVSPDGLAAEFIVIPRFPSVDSVLETAIKFAAWKFSMEPAVRCSIRREYFYRAVVSTRMTSAGAAQIEFGHEYHSIRSLQEKPVQYFDSEQFLLIMKAESENMISSRIYLEPGNYSSLVDLYSKFFECESSPWASSWTDLRKKVVRASFEHYLLPTCEKYTRRKLEEIATKAVVSQCVKKFFAKVSIIPEEFPKGLAAFAVGEEKSPSYIVMLDSYGRVQDQLVLHFLKNNPRRGGDASQAAFEKNSEDFRKLQAFLRKHKPALIVIDACSMEARNLREKILQANTGSGLCSVDFIDPEISRIYKSSYRAKMEFRDSNPLLPYVVSLGRLRLDPLSEIAGLCAKNADMLSLSLHPLQDRVSQRLLIRGLRRVLIDVTAHVGVNINLMANMKHLSGPLQFAGGLGPRKAKYILQMVSKKGILIERNELLEHEIVGPCVYRNLAGFIRVKPLIDVEIPPVEDCRIHPNSYGLLDRILSASGDTVINGDPARSRFINSLRKTGNFSGLEELDLDKYAETMENRNEGKFGDTMHDMIKELKQPWKDRLRQVRKPYSDKDLFTLFTGEVVDVTLRVGQIVAGRVISISTSGVRVALDSDIIGFIPFKELTDDNPALNFDTSMNQKEDPKLVFIRKYADVGRSIRCRITEIILNKFEVRLTAKNSDLQNRRYWEGDTNEDPYLKEIREVDDIDGWKVGSDRGYDSMKTAKPIPSLPQRKPFIERPIVHAYFRNIDRIEAIDILNSSNNDFVVRPSTRGIDRLTITWKVADDLYAHLEVEEKDKSDIPQEIGASLYICGQKFESLDEIIATYLRPIIANIHSIAQSRKFRAGSELEAMLKAEKESNRRNIPYLIGFDYKHPGYLVLAYLPKDEVFQESIKVTPDGYQFRKQIFESPDKLVQYFKVNTFNQPQPRGYEHASSGRSSGSSRGYHPSSGYQFHQSSYQSYNAPPAHSHFHSSRAAAHGRDRRGY